MPEEDKIKKAVDLSKTDEMKVNQDGSIVVGSETYSSMEDFSASIKEREEEIKK